ncbi:hypothetical protein CALVIDRAFT_539008 [Calocera viscosa TUFC12733]|uniref:Uncharacterized protein n=1 Tax=Calocera viscosa (strain TUFC12733) TaxID=1330018 RepID=A0A167KEB5_CALVF|nr:hypothetical protein CALVIDRAFT_539008 [Calocera viscosa TUFC12733]
MGCIQMLRSGRRADSRRMREEGSSNPASVLRMVVRACCLRLCLGTGTRREAGSVQSVVERVRQAMCLHDKQERLKNVRERSRVLTRESLVLACHRSFDWPDPPDTSGYQCFHHELDYVPPSSSLVIPDITRRQFASRRQSLSCGSWGSWFGTSFGGE